MGAFDSELKGLREPAVAGLFYPARPDALRRELAVYLAGAESPPLPGCPPALIVPHAGYIYSGPVAASAYACWQRWREEIDCVVMLGPSHRVWFRGLALPAVRGFRTPLGDVPLAVERVARLLTLSQVHVMAAAHHAEHSLEVHLPFLQALLGDFSVVPLVVGEATAAEVAEVLDTIRPGAGTVILISSDLSHYHPYARARALDRETSLWIEQLDGQRLDGERACGYRAIAGLLRVARRQGWQAHTLDLRNSGDTAGDKRQVVGYGAYAFAASPARA